MLKGTWAALKLLILHLEYWFVGLDAAGFQVRKGNHLAQLGLYAGAARAYARALQETKSPLVYMWLAWCYLNMDMPDRAIDTLGEAYARTPRADVGVMLAQAYIDAGNLIAATQLLAKLRALGSSISTTLVAELSRLEAMLERAAVERSRLSGHAHDVSADA